MNEIDVEQVQVNGIKIEIATAGRSGGSLPPVVLLHGFPHTWRVWTHIIPALARTRRVLAPDLRGLGGSSRAADGYDTRTLGRDLAALLDAVGEQVVSLVAIDLGVSAAFQFALDHPHRLDRLVLTEAVVPGLPGAESFLAGGPPWWFGFHGVPGLAESVLAGHEEEYLDFFLRAGTLGEGVDTAIHQAFVAAYSRPQSLRCAFEHYRAAPANAELVRGQVATARLTMPTLAIGAQPVGGALHSQLSSVTDDLVGQVIPDCGHIIPLHRPQALLDVLVPFLDGHADETR